MNSDKSSSSILLVDDEPEVLHACQRLLRGESFKIVTSSSAAEALQKLEQDTYAVVVADYGMPGMNGVMLLEKTKELSPDTVRLILTGRLEMSIALEAINHGAVHRFLTKPWNDEELRLAICQAVTQYENAINRRRAEEKLRISELSLAEEHERQRVAIYLHDRIAQYLVGASIKLNSLVGSNLPAEITQDIEKATSWIEHATKDIRMLITKLNSPTDLDADLSSALRVIAREIDSLFEVRVVVNIDESLPPMTVEIRIPLIQMVRELLVNAAKHSKAQEIEVFFRPQGDKIEAVVKDRGVGFDVEKIGAPIEGVGGFGLNSIRNRVKQAGGSFIIKSALGEGTEMTVILPAKSAGGNFRNG